MKVLQINGYESPGRRFNGLSITPLLKTHGIDSRHFIWQKDTQNPDVLTFDDPLSRKLNAWATRLETKMSLQSIFYPHVLKLMRTAVFKEADLIHLHIIHSGYFSLWALPKISRLKPVIWTLHDPWALTGHCIHPFDCTRWQIGCGQCPNLESHFSLRKDNTRLLFKYKKKVYQRSQFQVIVASKWMRDKVEKSPLFENVQIHQVPFGINLNHFSPEAKPNARNNLGIDPETLVLCFRAIDNTFKGLNYIIDALKKIKTVQKICLLTLNDVGLMDQFKDRFQVIDLGWTNDETVLRDAIAAADIFLMPSLVEAFGMMAIEALACAKPIIVFEGTALPEITFAPDIGITVPKHDLSAFIQTLQNLIDNPIERAERGRKGREIAERHYSEELYAKRIATIYKEAMQ